MMFLRVICLMVLFTHAAFGQTYGLRKCTLDTLKLKLEADSAHTYRFKKLRPWGNIDNRNSFVRPSNFNGYQLGVIFKDYNTMGIGYYRLNEAAKARSTLNTGFQLSNLAYGTIFYQYLLFKRRFFEIDLPFEIGYGEYRAKITDTTSLKYDQHFVNTFLPLSVGMKFIFKPVKWLGVSLMVGYRHFLEKEKVLEFNGLYYPVGVWVDLRQIYRDIKYYGFQKKRYRRAVKKANFECEP